MVIEKKDKGRCFRPPSMELELAERMIVSLTTGYSLELKFKAGSK